MKRIIKITMRIENVILVGAIIAVFGIVAGSAFAMADPAGGSVVGTATDQGAYSGTSAGTIDVVSGHIYEANVTGEQSTYHWTGVYGNAAGNLILGDSSSEVMYNWTATATYVFFDDDSTVNWNTLATATCTDVESSFSFLSGASDNCANTFTTTHDPSFKSIQDIAATSAVQTYDDTGAGYWWTLAVKDSTAGDVLFAAEVDTSGHNSYNGVSSNYQVILPENGELGDTTATTYYIWIELY